MSMTKPSTPLKIPTIRASRECVGAATIDAGLVTCLDIDVVVALTALENGILSRGLILSRESSVVTAAATEVATLGRALGYIPLDGVSKSELG